ncbi:zinc finger, CCHC-type containing protein [Tanacetum coccineum]
MKPEKIKVEEASSSQIVGYYLKHNINEKLVEGLANNQRFNDALSAIRVGIAEDVLIDVVGYVYPVNFMIMDIREDEKRPFILGTPFLTTAKATIKFDKGTITLKSGQMKVSFHRIPEIPEKNEKRIKNNIEPIAPTVTVNRLVLEWEENIKLHREKINSRQFGDHGKLNGNDGNEVIFDKNKLGILMKFLWLIIGGRFKVPFADIGDNF